MSFSYNEEYKPDPPKQTVPTTNTRSEKLVQKMKAEKYKELFQALNPDTHERLSAENAQLENIEAAQLALIAPILEEMETFKVTIDYQDFVNAMENLMAKLTPGEKSSLLTPRKKQTTDRAPRSPSVNKSRTESTPRATYNRLISHKRETEAKLQQKREDILSEELIKCTFHPKITPFKPPKAFKGLHGNI
jgi:hypothetical protein